MDNEDDEDDEMNTHSQLLLYDIVYRDHVIDSPYA